MSTKGKGSSCCGSRCGRRSLRRLQKVLAALALPAAVVYDVVAFSVEWCGVPECISNVMGAFSVAAVGIALLRACLRALWGGPAAAAAATASSFGIATEQFDMSDSQDFSLHVVLNPTIWSALKCMVTSAVLFTSAAGVLIAHAANACAAMPLATLACLCVVPVLF